MTDHPGETESQPTWTRLVGMDSAHPYALFTGRRTFPNGERIPVDPPGTVVIVRGAGTVKAEGAELVLEYVVQRERQGNDVGQS